MHDLSLRPGRKTSEFLALVVSVSLQWIAMALSVLTDIVDVIPESKKPYALIAIAALTSLQTTIYAVKRGDLKKAAIASVAGYNETVVNMRALEKYRDDGDTELAEPEESPYVEAENL